MVAQADAAAHGQYHRARVGSGRACENLDPAENPDGEAGVTIASIERELEWRTDANWRARLRRAFLSTVRWI